MKRPAIIGVMGGSHVSDETLQRAHQLGCMIAEEGWILLNGGRNAGVMAASARGASEKGGITVGILPEGDAAQAAEAILIPICTGMGSARNVINVLSSDVVVACSGEAGTISEIALALKHQKRVITLAFQTGELFAPFLKTNQLMEACTAREVIQMIKDVLSVNSARRTP